MLDSPTRKRIDDCRDILVGKLPDPKAQIEQITIALIYKFMDDMDKEAIELGGKAKFFSDYYMPDPKNPGKEIKVEFRKFSWDNLFDSKVTASQMLSLYSEAITAIDKNPNIPHLFRDIFKNAFLPYRDPETLKLFLKTIGEFEYTHSEKLGDAFEYLLSVMGSQGDAGQFRTPRHIIDFLVSVVDPKKTDNILDPACGTAGFLISAFKHILLNDTKANKDKLNIFQYNNNYDEAKPFNNLGDQQTPDERKKVIRNFTGYDISPDMVRLSLVNLYLHGFSDPHIFEYDTLTSEDRWNETYDVILANPPFMSPKGGIRPHKKFSISSNRSEVLFVDYIAEHLNPKGRAGIIVPEGVIFQSGTAYKELRRSLVENYLYAVVSLPAGVFNPYSGVKTSILLMDKELAKTTEEILFVKIDNDGYGLGAQRNKVKGGQLEQAIDLIRSYAETRCLASQYASIAHAVSKAEIAKNGDYNLSGERYKTQISSTTVYPLIPIEELFESIRNGRNVEQIDEVGIYRVTRIQTIADKTVDLEKTKWTNDEVPEDYFMEEGDILLSHINSFEHLAKSAIFKGISEKVVHGTNLIRFKPNKNKIVPEYVAEIFKSEFFIDKAKTFAQKAVNQASLRVADLKNIEIPLPPISVQEEIVAEIEGYQKVIDGAKMVVENYKPHINIDPGWEMVELQSICDVRDGTHDSPKYKEEGYPLITSKNVKEGRINFEEANLISKEDLDIINKRSLVEDGDIIMPMIGTIGNPIVIKKDRDFAVKNVALIKFYADSKINRYYLKYILDSDYFSQFYQKQASGSTQKFISLGFIRSIRIPLAPLDTQQKIVYEIEKEQELVNASRQLIEIFEQKIKERIGKVWGL